MILEILHNLDLAWRGLLLFAMFVVAVFLCFVAGPAFAFSSESSWRMRLDGMIAFAVGVLLACSWLPVLRVLF